MDQPLDLETEMVCQIARGPQMLSDTIPPAHRPSTAPTQVPAVSAPASPSQPITAPTVTDRDRDRCERIAHGAGISAAAGYLRRRGVSVPSHYSQNPVSYYHMLVSDTVQDGNSGRSLVEREILHIYRTARAAWMDELLPGWRGEVA